MNADEANSGLVMMMRRGMMMMGMVTLVATFLDHSEPSPLPPLRLLGHGGD